MRIPFGQIYFSLGLATTYRPSTSRQLARFLAASKAQYLSDVQSSTHHGEKWTIVMGNEAGDLDSIASSIAFAWIQTNIHHKPTIPLIQTHHHDLPLRPENLHALALAGIHDPESQLLTLTDISDITPFPTNNFALVDHNRLGAPYLLPSARVTAVIDHHDDEGFYNDTAHPRIIAPSGSCSSHVANLAPRNLPSDLATLLLSAVLIDTAGLKPGGKVLPVDLRAAAFLAERSAHIPSPLPEKGLLHQTPEIRNLTDVLLERKKNVRHLTTSELVRRDYKEYTYTLPWAANDTLLAGLSTVPLSLDVMDRDDDLGEAMISWMMSRKLSVLGVMTSFRDDEDYAVARHHQREMAWVVQGAGLKGANLDELAERLWKNLENSEELALREHGSIWLGEIPRWARSRTYQMGNAHASRKVTAPLLRTILESP